MYPEKKLHYPICPKCLQLDYSQKDGKNSKSFTQKYYCAKCGINYTPNKTTKAYPDDVRSKAIQLCQSMSMVKVAMVLGVSRCSVRNWWNSDNRLGLHNDTKG